MVKLIVMDGAKKDPDGIMCIPNHITAALPMSVMMMKNELALLNNIILDVLL